MSRPHYLPEVVWMGKKIGEWPIETWEDEESARRWAAEYPDKRRFWSVKVPDDTVIFKAEVVPATTRVEQVSP